MFLKSDRFPQESTLKLKCLDLKTLGPQTDTPNCFRYKNMNFPFWVFLILGRSSETSRREAQLILFISKRPWSQTAWICGPFLISWYHFGKFPFYGG